MEKSVAVLPESVLKIDFSELLTDSPSTNPLAGIDLTTMETTRQLSLFRALRAIEAAGADARIKGIYLRMNGRGGVTGTALLEELRGAIGNSARAASSSSPTTRSIRRGNTTSATAADRIYMQPEGMIDWSGLSLNLMFYKGLLDKLDIRAEVFRPTACRYKSAVEPYIMNRMSDANREQMQELVNSMWGTISSTVAEARGIDPAELNAADRPAGGFAARRGSGEPFRRRTAL